MQEPEVILDSVVYTEEGGIKGVYITVTDKSCVGKYWVTPVLIEPLSFTLHVAEDYPELKATLAARNCVVIEHITACLDALDYAQSGGRGGRLNSDLGAKALTVKAI
jgi:hypothetical protein